MPIVQNGYEPTRLLSARPGFWPLAPLASLDRCERRRAANTAMSRLLKVPLAASLRASAPRELENLTGQQSDASYALVTILARPLHDSKDRRMRSRS